MSGVSARVLEAVSVWCKNMVAEARVIEFQPEGREEPGKPDWSEVGCVIIYIL